MYHDSLIAMNIVYKNSILNDKYPILFYWNGINNPIDDILKDEKILAKLKEVITIEDLYYNATINYVTYKFDGENETYEEQEYYIKNLFSYDGIGLNVSQNIIIEILKEAYKKVYGAECDITWLNSFEEQVKQIIEGIRNHYTREISKETFINFIRKTYKEKYINDVSNDIAMKNENFLVKLAESAIE